MEHVPPFNFWERLCRGTAVPARGFHFHGVLYRPTIAAPPGLRSAPPLVLIAFLFPALAGFNFGYDIGSTGGAIVALGAEPGATALASDPLARGLLTSGSLIGAVLGTALCFPLAPALGRRGELLVASALYVVGTAASTLAPAGGSSLLQLVLVGRAIYGVGFAFAMHAAPVYISETAPPSVRGTLVSLKEGFIVLGILCGFGASALAAYHEVSSGWRAIWAPPALLALVVFAGMHAMPPSPRWLVLSAITRAEAAHSGRELEAARKALSRLRSPQLSGAWRGTPEEEAALEASVASELEAIAASASSSGASGGCAELWASRRALVAGLGLVLLQQVTGQPSVLYYQESIFRNAGFGEVAAYASLIVGCAKLLATMFAVSQVEKHGRKPLLFLGISMMLASLAALAVAFHQQPQSAAGGGSGGEGGPWPTVIVASLIVYVSGYQVGFGPISWLMISEVFPLRTRTNALAVASLVNFGFNLLATFSLPSLQHAFDAIEPGKGMAWLFACYGLLCVASLAFVAGWVPETKGKSLEEIERELVGPARPQASGEKGAT